MLIVSSQMQNGPADAPWAHDLHDSVIQADPAPTAPSSAVTDRQRPPVAPSKDMPNRSFSGSRHVGSVQVRVLLRGTAEPIVFTAVPVNQHTRLPHHRPPLRRDKPVRISLPSSPIRYIFPSIERSFIFIPRALRPNQQGFGRIRGRGSFGGHSGFGPLSSRRTSAYAGSGYSPSVAMSRRSSLARELNVEGIPSPARPLLPRPSGLAVEAGKPVVRLPPSAGAASTPNQPLLVPETGAASTVNQVPLHQVPQKPFVAGAGTDNLPMHHPRPERTLQVGDIDLPATLDVNPPQPQQQQPFHQQVPQLPVYQPDPSLYAHSRHPSHPSQVGTPLQHIPEISIHAQPFQPYPFAPQGFYPLSFGPPVYYYPPGPQPSVPPTAAAPPFVPGQPYFYPMPVGPPPPASGPEQAGPMQTVAHETGGMVYYYNPAEMAQGADATSQFPPSNFPPAPVGMGDVGPYYGPSTLYYPPQPQPPPH